MTEQVLTLAPAFGAGSTTQPHSRFRSHLSTPLYRSAYALVLNSGITSLIGLAYWAVAAHHYPAVEVGRASSAISAMQLLSGIAQCNLNNALPRLVPVAGVGAGRLIVRSYVLAGGLSVLLASGFAALADRYGWAGGFLSRGPGYVVWFVIAVAAWSIFFLEDGVLAGLRRAVWIPVENASFSIGKVILLLALAGITVRFGMFGSFTIPVAIAIIPVNWVIFTRFIPRHRGRPPFEVPRTAQPLRTYLAGEYVGGLANLATTTLLPLLVAAQIGSAANAYFYAAWVVGSSFEYVLSSIAVSLVVEGANDRSRADWAARRGTLIIGAVLVPAIVVTVVAAPWVLDLVGHRYAAEGTVILRLIAIAVLPRAVISLSVAMARIDRDVRTMVAVQASACVLTVGSATMLLPEMGLLGAGIAYVGAQTTVAVILLPRLIKRLRTPRTSTYAIRPGRHAPSRDGNGGVRDPRKSAPVALALPGTVLSIAASVALCALTIAGGHVGPQPLLAAGFLLWVPGATIVGFLGIGDRLLAAVLAVATSVAVGTLGAEAMLWTGAWHPRAAVIALTLTCAIALSVQWVGRPERMGRR